jgi:threonine dehydratase
LAGERVPVKVGGIAADSLGAQLGEVPWAISKHFVDEAVLVTDDDIRAAQNALWTDLRLVVEPGGAAAYAALMTGVVKRQEGEKVVVVVCGSNCDPTSVM